MLYIGFILQTCSIASTVPGASTRNRRGYPQPARVPAAGAGTRSRRGYPQPARVPAAAAGTRSQCGYPQPQYVILAKHFQDLQILIRV